MAFFVDVNSAGVKVKSLFGDEGGWVQFDGDTPIPIVWEGKKYNGYYISLSGDAVLVIGNPNPAPCFLIKRNGEIKELPHAVGQWACFQLGDNSYTCTQTYYQINGGPHIPNPFSTSQGFQQVNPNGEVIFNDPKTWPTYGGIKFQNHRYSDEWHVGNSNEKVYAYNDESDRLYLVANTESRVGYRISKQVGGGCIVGISLPRDEVTYFVSSDEFTEIKEPQVYNVMKYPRKMFCCPYDSFSEKYGITDDYVGNVVFPDYSLIEKVPAGMPLLMGQEVPLEIIKKYENSIMYYYVHDDEAMYRVIIRDWPWKGTIFYRDGRAWWVDRPSWMNKDRTLLGAQWYRNKDESVSEFRNALIKMMDGLKKYELPFAPSLMFYDRGGWFDEKQILECIEVYEELIDKYQVMGIMPFSDLRPNGMVKYPKLKEELKRMYNAIPVRPNRLDYWTTGSNEDLKTKLKYEMIVLTKAERNKLINLLSVDAFNLS